MRMTFGFRTSMLAGAPAGLALFLGIMLLACSSDDNPYVDASVAGVRFSLEGTPTDSVCMFTTRALEMSLILPALARDVRVTASGNRYWTDTSFTAEPALPNPLTLEVSFADTGAQSVRAALALDNGDTVISEQSFRCYSPLSQRDLLVYEGDTLRLSTPPVGDAVIYVWDLAGVVGPRYADGPTLIHVVDSQQLGPTARLFVRAGDARSPAHTFRLSLVDTRAPVVNVLNNTLAGRRITAGTDPFMLNVQIRDAAGIVSSATVNGESFERITPGDDEHTVRYGKWIEGTSNLGDDSLRIVIRALDNAANVALDTFWICYDSTLGETETPELEVISPDRDGMVVSQPTVTVNGTVRSLGARDSVLSYIQVNDSVFSEVPHVLRRDGDTWSWTIPLVVDTNEVVVRLAERLSALGTPLASASFSIIYNPTATDDQPPVIVSVTSNSVSIGASASVDTSPVPLTITAYDIGSGVKEVMVNDVAATPSSTEGQHTIDVPVIHTKEGTAVSIRVADSSDNVASRELTIYKNALPEFAAVPGLRHAVVNEPHSDTIQVSDPDGDSVTTTVTFRTAGSDSTVELDVNGTFIWTPGPADTGMVRVDVTAWDGYGVVDTSYFIAVRPGSEPYPEARFTTTVADFPDSLLAARDTLRVVLRVDQPPEPGAYSFAARVVESNQTLIDYTMDSVLTWAPSLSDTGVRNLEVVVISGEDHGDTLRPAVTVVPPVWVTFPSPSSSGSESAALCSVAVELSRASAETIHVSFTAGASGSTADTSDWNERTAGPLTFAPGSRTAHVVFDVVDDTRDEPDETLVINLTSTSNNARIGTARRHTYTILDNDTTLEPLDTPSVSFAVASDSGEEAADTLSIPVVLSAPAPWDIEVAIVSSGTATDGEDYVLTPHSAVFDSGDSAIIVALAIIDDTLCEPDDETLNLSLVTSGQPVKPGGVQSFSYTIAGNDSQYCPPKVYLVHRSGSRLVIDEAIEDSLGQWGYNVTPVDENGLDGVDLDRTAFVFISQSVAASMSSLRDVAVPIVSAGSAAHVELGLASNQDTGRGLAYRGLVLVDDASPHHQANEDIRLTSRLQWLPWITPSSGGVPTTCLYEWFSPQRAHASSARFTAGAALNGGDTAPARRATLTMASGQSAMDDAGVYSSGWWTLLKASLTWVQDE